MSHMRRESIIAWLFNTPYLLYSIVFMAVPLLWAIWLAMTDWNLISPDYEFLGYSKGISKMEISASTGISARNLNRYLGYEEFSSIYVPEENAGGINEKLVDGKISL